MGVIMVRSVSPQHQAQLEAAGLAPLAAQLYAARGVGHIDDLHYVLTRLAPFHTLKNIACVADRLVRAIVQRERMLVVADYDSDGATACTVAVRGLSMLGGLVDFIIPNRFQDGYGLTPGIVELAMARSPQLLITVDNGIASVEGVLAAKKHGVDVIITDHHLPDSKLPDALIVNPNQPGCDFPSKKLAGVGVIFYVLLALRATLRERGHFTQIPEPNLSVLLDLVALGTIADMVPLDMNNRILVSQGLRRIRQRRACPGMLALFQVSGRQPEEASCSDLGFMLGPRLNAAGRLDDMSVGVACLLSPCFKEALALAKKLDAMNRLRREIEATMQEQAQELLAGMTFSNQYSVVLYRSEWHQGVIGIIASRIKDYAHRPTIVFADGMHGELKGSGRSIPGFHLRDALGLLSKTHPGLMLKFGGHAMAAGLSVRPEDLACFRESFEAICQKHLMPDLLSPTLWVDGELPREAFSLKQAEWLEQQVWGQGFPAPLFHGCFKILEQRLIQQKHLKLKLLNAYGQVLPAIYFQARGQLPSHIRAVYSLNVNEFRQQRTLQMQLSYCEAST